MQRAKFEAKRYPGPTVVFFVRSFEPDGEVPADIRAALKGWTRVDLSTYRSPPCKTPDEINKVRGPLAKFKSRLVSAEVEIARKLVDAGHPRLAHDLMVAAAKKLDLDVWRVPVSDELEDAHKLAKKLAGELNKGFARLDPDTRGKIQKAWKAFFYEIRRVDFYVDPDPDEMRRMERASVQARQAKHKLNKYDPGSLLGRVVWLLDEAGLDDAAKDVRRVSSVVQRAWQTREK